MGHEAGAAVDDRRQAGRPRPRQCRRDLRRIVHALAEAPALAARLAVPRALLGPDLSGDANRMAARFEALQAHLVLLVTGFLRRAAPLSADEGRRALRDTLVQRYRGLVEIHLRRPMPLAFYADALDVTADHLSRTCRTVTGQSALDLLHEQLVLEARRLLAYTAAPVADVARDLGFEDASYFSRFFARRTGRSPRDWRAALLTGQATVP